MSHRRPYTRPSDSDSDDPDDDEALDEEHQELLIRDLAVSDADRSTLYRRIFLFVPLLSTLPFLITLFSLLPSSTTPTSTSNGTTKRDRMLAILSISSLLCTAWWLWYLPYQKNHKSKDVLGVSRLSSLTSAVENGSIGDDNLGKRGRRMGRKEQAGGSSGDARGPLGKYMGLLNGGLAGLLFGMAVLMAARADGGLTGDGALTAWRWCVPAFVFALTAFVRHELAPLDLEDLQRARYEYKGA